MFWGGVPGENQHKQHANYQDSNGQPSFPEASVLNTVWYNFLKFIHSLIFTLQPSASQVSTRALTEERYPVIHHYEIRATSTNVWSRNMLYAACSTSCDRLICDPLRETCFPAPQSIDMALMCLKQHTTCTTWKLQASEIVLSMLWWRKLGPACQSVIAQSHTDLVLWGLWKLPLCLWKRG